MFESIGVLPVLLVGGCAFAFLKWALKPAPALSSELQRPLPADVDWKKRPGLKASMEKHAPRTGDRYLVIGTGSVGLSIIEALTARGESVTGFDIAPARREIPGVQFIRGSVTDYAAVRAACQEVDVVYATVALIRYYERAAWQYPESHAVNVTGTSNIIKACLDAGVKLLIQTSTSNVCVAPDLVGDDMDENSPMVDQTNSPNHYGWTKVQAERAVIAANGQSHSSGRLLTGCIRPCSGIFGPEDNFISERYMREGQVQQFISWSKIDYVFVENVVWGHLLLERGLRDKPQEVGGQTFCISNVEPIVADDFYRSLAQAYKQVTGKTMAMQYIPYRLLIGLSYFLEAMVSVTRYRIKGDAANLSGAMINLATLSYSFSSKKANKMLGYEPLYTVDEALQRSVHMWTEYSAGKSS
eukprot:TRINITY_DN77019_c0_g1_i1.p1 TRINITY_DN77019_c0_g1~~TRINITY_DN77019_c0_g1_i1.p1  ORF type:complete len:428 (-),score=74.20 TRINITY_DN77019_c0_g1_i1:215-1456(-)